MPAADERLARDRAHRIGPYCPSSVRLSNDEVGVSPVSESDRIVLAVPSMAEGGIQGTRCEHFGTCDTFTIVELEAGTMGDVKVVNNVPHAEDSCYPPVKMLVENGVTAVIVAAIGADTMKHLDEAGIAIYFDDQLPYVAQAVGAVRSGNAKLIDPNASCSGCDAC
jgi:predicted Fe-Mo cluster-binding NifX family protein